VLIDMGLTYKKDASRRGTIPTGRRPSPPDLAQDSKRVRSLPTRLS
jgi:hypothetical protein